MQASREVATEVDLHGVLITGANATGNKLLGNRIGTDKGSGAAVGNIIGGVKVDGSNGNLIGDSTVNGGGNTISGNGITGAMVPAPGIEIVNANSTLVQANRIGLRASSPDAIKNYGDGVLITSGTRNIIGGAGDGEPNTISGNGGKGIVDNGTANLTLFNFTGTDKTGAMLPNEQGGILVTGSNAVVQGNQVWFNTGTGIAVTSGTGNKVTTNSIKGNTALGIDLNDDGVTANDSLDPDTGPNNFQNFPVLTSAIVAAGSTTITGTLNSTATSLITLEFFGNNAVSASDAEGEYYLGSTTVTTDGSGNASFSLTLSVAYGNFVTATATDSSSNTSEFSAALAVTQASPASTVQGLVWADADSDGIQDLGEGPVAGVLVRLYNSIGTLIGSTFTNGSGAYSFTSVAAGTYYVTFQLPTSGYTGFSPQDQGWNDAIDSDPNASGITAFFTLLGTDVKDHLDAGLIPD